MSEYKISLLIFFAVLVGFRANAQTIKGVVIDETSAVPLFAVNVGIKGTTSGTSTDFDGEFILKVESLPVTLVFRLIGYGEKEVEVKSASERINVKMLELVIDGPVVIIEDFRVTEKQKQAPLTVENLDLIAIKQAPSGNFYEALGTLKGVDLTTASLGFRIINTRGFNSTSPVRTLQLIDGVDNQSPGLNFSLGNFLGAPDLDVKSVDIVQGASSAFFGPGAFNGVINMETKNPFLFQGFSAQMKVGERALLEPQIRWAQAFKNKEGEDKFAYKINLYYIRANDWEATDYSPIYGSEHGTENPYGFDAVNIYGDEAIATNNDYTDSPFEYTGLGVFYRNGYREDQLTDYTLENFKSSAAAFYKIKSDLTLSYQFNFSTGSTVYQGDNRYRLKDIRFWQNKIELKKDNKWFVRAYTTGEDAGNTYDIVTTGIRLLDAAGTTAEWNTRVASVWRNTLDYDALVRNQPRYGQILSQVGTSGLPPAQQLELFQNLLGEWYIQDTDFFSGLYQNTINTVNATTSQDIQPFYQPGTDRFNDKFNEITSTTFTEGGSLFYDRSKLYHVHGEYKFTPTWATITTGGNVRWYRPDSRGTIFSDTLQYTYLRNADGGFVLDDQGRRVATDSSRVEITNFEYGAYVGVEKKVMENKLILNATGRVDKNQNFDYLFSPAASIVYNRNPNNVFRLTFSSALRNPTLADQYLFYNVGRAILLGNVDGRFEAGNDSLITLDSFNEYRNTSPLSTGLAKLDYFNVDRIRPERARTIEVGYRGIFSKKFFLDASYYYTRYIDFIGFNLGISARFTPEGLPDGGIQVYRVAVNATQAVTTQGFNIGGNYFFRKTTLNANYSWNRLNSGEDDPIIPAFNTPEHKYNLGISAKDLVLFNKVKNVGYSINYKWIENFIFEGSPQFTGPIPSYDMVDAQINIEVPKVDCTFKLGASNLMGIRPFFDKDLGDFNERASRAFRNLNLQVYGGPLVGRMIYFSVLYEPKMKNK
ncbi:MAG: TonB-dependent receptor [Flavobacteriales bacterium]|jgi:iron complex outermembrane receptor protein